MKRKIWLVTCILIFVLGCNLLSSAEAEIFDIGKKLSESDPHGNTDSRFYYFDSGCVLRTNNNNSLDFGTKIFDGNLSTGINQFYKKDFYRLSFFIHFLDPLYVNNITVKPNFGGNSSRYDLRIIYNWYNMITLAADIGEEKTYKINCPIEEIRFDIFEIVNGTNNTGYISCNDLIIDYTPSSSSNINEMQDQIDVINQYIQTLDNNVISIDEAIINLNQNITNIKNNIPSEYDDTAIKNQIDNLTQELNSMNENLIKINNSIPTEYDDSALESNIFDLESENVILQQKIGNITIKIANLTTELEKLSSEVQNLQAQGGAKKGDDEQDNILREYTYNIIFGVIIVILLIITLKLSLVILKHKHQNLEGPKTDGILLNQIKNNMLTDSRMKETRLYDDEYKAMLETRFQKGEMSQESYNYIKKVLAVSEDTQNLEK
jgi:hypothetical protein